MKSSLLVDHPLQSRDNFILDRLLVKWVDPLIRAAYHQPLEDGDVWSVSDTPMSVQHHASMFSAAWREECARSVQEGREPNLRKTLLGVYSGDILRGGVFQFVFMMLQLLQPYIIGHLLQYISSEESHVAVGIMWALILGTVAFVSSSVLVMAFTNNRIMGTHMRAAMMMSVYEHSMKISNASRMKNDIGTTTNLMAIDSEKIFLASQFLHFLW